MSEKYTEINSKVIDKWVEEGWEWGQPVSHEMFEKAKNNDWYVLLTPTKPVPKDWFCEIKNAEILGLACGGGQQMLYLQHWVQNVRYWIIRKSNCLKKKRLPKEKIMRLG
ncbi:hypothetical protein [Acetivibrio straminisolvens]|uniref:Methyltransferase n=1 Tax=Acetivibrio straminisolvens JCM 21531 TaxID=1294263 RepID=W4V643_9FIRM|nr:methyltransferase [Acetivibrio straminisolvens JCM 21531]